MLALLLHTPQFPVASAIASRNNGTQYNNNVFSNSVSFLTHTHPVKVHQHYGKIALAHGRRPQQRMRQSPTSLQAQVDNTLPEVNESEDVIIRQKLQELADSLVLPPNYLAQLPNDLRLDLNDAAFDLANGPVNQECGEKFGEMLMQLSQAWEKADTQGTAEIASRLPSLQGSSTLNVESVYSFCVAVGKRLIRAGRRFESMGQYGQGELQKIAKSMIAAGKALAKDSSSAVVEQQPIDQTRTFKFGTLQVELTSKKAYIGTVFALVFGILSWKLSTAVQSRPEDSFQYANDNSLLLAKSLRGTLLALCYSSTVLSGLTMVGLFLYGRQLSSEGK